MIISSPRILSTNTSFFIYLLQATLEDLEELILMVEGLKLEVTRLSGDLYRGP